jgi:hypothetical protein
VKHISGSTQTCISDINAAALARIRALAPMMFAWQRAAPSVADMARKYRHQRGRRNDKRWRIKLKNRHGVA